MPAYFRLDTTVELSKSLWQGKKSLAVSAHRDMDERDRRRIIVVVDCDGDAGQLCGSPNLVITTYNDLEADLVMADRLGTVITQLLAGRTSSRPRLKRFEKRSSHAQWQQRPQSEAGPTQPATRAYLFEGIRATSDLPVSEMSEPRMWTHRERCQR